MAYIFLDESGQFTKHDNEQYFVVGSFMTGDYRRKYHEKKELCEECFDILRNNIIGSDELFKEHWETKFRNKKPNRND